MPQFPSFFVEYFYKYNVHLSGKTSLSLREKNVNNFFFDEEMENNNNNFLTVV